MKEHFREVFEMNIPLHPLLFLFRRHMFQQAFFFKFNFLHMRFGDHGCGLAFNVDGKASLHL